MINSKRPTLRQTVIKVLKKRERERISKVARGKRHVTYKEATVSLTTDFLLETTVAEGKVMTF